MSPPATPSLFYRGVRGVVRAALNVFYRTVEVTGGEHLDPSVPTILACNHPNSIVDPLLLGLAEDRQVCFCARDGLFAIPGLGALLRAVGAVPLQRRSDRGGGAVDNQAAFAACREALTAGGALAIFPEGKTHERMRIEPLKTGAARIALDAAADPRCEGLVIVPIGITYLVRHAFLSDVHVAVGAPIRVAELARAREGDDPKEVVRALTARLEDEMRVLALHIDEAEDERLIVQVTSIVAGIRADEGLDEGGQSPAERTALAQRGPLRAAVRDRDTDSPAAAPKRAGVPPKDTDAAAPVRAAGDRGAPRGAADALSRARGGGGGERVTSVR